MTPADPCPSELRLVQLDAGEGAAPVAARAAAHVTGCRRCQARRAEIAAVRRQVAASSASPPSWLAPPARRSWRRRAVVPALAMAAALALVVVGWRGPGGIATDGGERRKGGGLVLTVYIHRDGAVVPGADGAPVFPADQLRFALSGAVGARYVAVLSLDGGGRASVYAPVDAGPLRLQLGGPRQLVPGAIELDDVIGPERLIGLACDRPIAVAALRARLEADRALPPPAGCVSAELTLDKRARVQP